MKYVKRHVLTSAFVLVAILLSGCMYPGDDEGGGKIVYEEHVDSIQSAVDQFREDNDGILPIRTKDEYTDKYIKYPIEFSKIIPQYMDKIPSSSYEKGGLYQYVIMDAEENPTVKAVDLRAAEMIRDLNMRKSANGGKVPFTEEINNGVYEVDFTKYGFKDQLTLESPYSDVHLPLVVGGDGYFYVDYSIDLQKIMDEEKPKVKEGEDIRILLEERSNIVPAYSLPYTVNEDGEVVFMKK